MNVDNVSVPCIGAVGVLEGSANNASQIFNGLDFNINDRIAIDNVGDEEVNLCVLSIEGLCIVSCTDNIAAHRSDGVSNDLAIKNLFNADDLRCVSIVAELIQAGVCEQGIRISNTRLRNVDGGLLTIMNRPS